MIKFDNNKIKLLSTIGPRASIGLHLLDVVKNNNNIMVLTSDVSTSAGLDRFRKKYKENYLDIGIAEQNLIGVAAGLSLEGYDVITTTFAPFQTMRCCEQIKVNLGYMNSKVIMIGIASGLVLGQLGYTHCCIEDIGVLKSIPNITIISPSDSLETLKAIDASLNNKESTYIRVTGGTNNPIINSQDYNFEIGKPIELIKGNDVTIFSNGAILNEAMKASEILRNKNISCSVINVHTLKPVSLEVFENFFEDKKLIATVEEHNVIGGLGSTISDLMSQKKNLPNLIKFGINDNYSFHGDYEFLKKSHGLKSENIAGKILDNLKKT